MKKKGNFLTEVFVEKNEIRILTEHLFEKRRNLERLINELPIDSVNFILGKPYEISFDTISKFHIILSDEITDYVENFPGNNKAYIFGNEEGEVIYWFYWIEKENKFTVPIGNEEIVEENYNKFLKRLLIALVEESIIELP